MAPGVGIIADLTNAGISVARGNHADAALSMAVAVPLAGIAKIARKAKKALGKTFSKARPPKETRRIATGFKGRKGFELRNAPYQKVRNQPTTINDREFSAHALDQMQNRGIMPSVVENAIKTGKAVPGNLPGRTVYRDATNNIFVVTDSATGRVITARGGQ